jgi:2-polyprenyl-3-methyl-5-hydroxy-6-metoxy-1,4-benzoquinol methylase
MTNKDSNEHQAQLEENRKIWDKEAASFDNEADHGLGQSHVRAAWKKLLENTLSGKELGILDIGCGTGSLSILLAELGHTVTGVDLSPAMIELAEAKAKKAQRSIRFQVMDAAFPELPSQKFDAIICRHLLWTLPEPKQVLQRWMKLLKPEGRLLLIEGFWHTGAGLHAKDILAMLPESVSEANLQNLSKQADFWGTAVTDERYMITAVLAKELPDEQ